MEVKEHLAEPQELVHQEIISGEGQMAFAFRLTLKIIRSDWLPLPIPITKLFSKIISVGWADDVTLKIMPSLGLVSAQLWNCFGGNKNYFDDHPSLGRNEAAGGGKNVEQDRAKR